MGIGRGVVAGSGSDVAGRETGRYWKMIRMQLLEEEPDVAGSGSDVIERGSDVAGSWKWIGTPIGRDPDAVTGSVLEGTAIERNVGRCC